MLSKSERTAATNILIANAELDRAVKELSTRFAAMENAVASIDDAETRIRLELAAKLTRHTLLSAILELNRVVGEFVGHAGR